MGINYESAIYLCTNHLVPSGEPGNCTICGRELVGCRPGDPDDPCRRPMIDAQGRIQTRAPRWWLQQSIAELMQHIQGEK